MTVFSIQLRATIIILIVVLVRSLFLYKMPKKILLGMWILVLARLFVPFTGNFSLGFSIPRVEDIWFSFLHTFGKAQIPDTSNSVADVQFSTYSVPWFLWGIWLMISIVLAAYFIAGHIRGRRTYRFAYPARSTKVLQWAQKNKIRRNVKILECPDLSSALTYGVLRPVIMLPGNIYHEDSGHLDFVLSHEMAHIRNFDILLKWLSAAALCMNWYNPMVWVMYILIGRDIELHCDECVLKKFGLDKKNKSEYALALLLLAEGKNTGVPLAGHFSRSATEERILAVMHSRYAPAFFIAAAVLGIAVLSFLSFVSFFLEAGIAETFPLY